MRTSYFGRGIAALVLAGGLSLAAAVPAGAASGRTAPAAPAAKYIGVDAYHDPTWGQVGTPGSKWYLGMPQSEKFFYNNEALPDSDAATTAEYNVPGCGATTGTPPTYVYPANTECIVVWNTATSPTGADLQNFLMSTLTDPHRIVMAFCNEPEVKDHHDASGCQCDPGGGTVGPCNSSAAIINQFEVESSYIRRFEAQNGATNVKVAEISWGDYYKDGTNGCSVNPTSNPANYLVPYQYVDFYLVDVYQGGGNPITSPEPLSQDPAWNNWVTCTQAPGVSRGISEFAINCGNEQKSLDGGLYEEAVANSFTEDDAYLKANFPNLEVWNLWDYGGCALDNLPGDEPDSAAAWQNIEAGN